MTSLYANSALYNAVNPTLHNVGLKNAHDKKEFAKLTKISNYINTIEHIVNVCKSKGNFPCESYGVELLEKLKYILELRLGSDKVIMNNASILIGESIDHILSLSHEYIKSGKYALGETYMNKQYSQDEYNNLDNYSKDELLRYGLEPKLILPPMPTIPKVVGSMELSSVLPESIPGVPAIVK
jgi:hypothetical protein